MLCVRVLKLIPEAVLLEQCSIAVQTRILVAIVFSYIVIRSLVKSFDWAISAVLTRLRAGGYWFIDWKSERTAKVLRSLQ